MTATDIEAEAEVRAGPPWWTFLVFGIVWLFFGFLVLSLHRGEYVNTVDLIAVFAGALFLAMGLSEFVVASAVKDRRWLNIALGVVGVVAGFVAFLWPGRTFLALAAIIAWFLLFKGTLDFVGGLLAKDDNELWWLGLVAGILEILIGFWAIGYPGRSALLLVVWVGAGALVGGVMNIVLAFRLRDLQQ